MDRSWVQIAITDTPTCAAAAYASEYGIQVQVYPGAAGTASTEGQPVLATPDELVESLLRAQVDFVLLAGYLKLVPTEVVAAFHRRMLNIHPSLLPAFGGKGMYGRRVHTAVVASGCRCVSDPHRLLAAVACSLALVTRGSHRAFQAPRVPTANCKGGAQVLGSNNTLRR